MPIRKIVQIDEDKCNGCGECIPSCAEGAIRIVNGKARLVADALCDGLGACLGHCPKGAITITEREAGTFDERLVQGQAQHACPGEAWPNPAAVSRISTGPTSVSSALPIACPIEAGEEEGRTKPSGSGLNNWPVQLHLVSPTAPFFRGADVLLVANCVPFAVMDFHERFVRGGVCLTACPKLDNTHGYSEKLAAIMLHGGIRSLTVVRMSVPCCGGLVRITEAAHQAANPASVPLREITVSSRGDITSEKVVN